MFHEDEFGLLSETFRKSRVRVNAVSPDGTLLGVIDDDMKPFFEKFISEEISVGHILGPVDHETVYRFKDNLALSYTAFLVPHNEVKTLIIIGPYLYEPLSREQILEISEQNGFAPKNQKTINEYFSSIPVIPETSPLFLLLDSFCERMWNGAYEVVEVYRGLQLSDHAGIFYVDGKEIDDTFLSMKNMERRYKLENEIMDAVMLGSEHKLNRIFASFTESAFESRVTDPLRNSKNYCIIMNTLLRKAAERGGVHPMHLDRISSKFAVEIEQIPSTEKINVLMAEMFKSYCKLVHKHSLKEYSPFVQKAIAAIESDPSAELNLHSVAEKLNVSNVYLSSVFKKETGKTITEYIREKRLSYAAHLLKSTNLQIQTVALHCGMVDVQYFSKLFKKHTGKTPTQFRADSLRG